MYPCLKGRRINVLVFQYSKRKFQAYFKHLGSFQELLLDFLNFTVLFNMAFNAQFRKKNAGFVYFTPVTFFIFTPV